VRGRYFLDVHAALGRMLAMLLAILIAVPRLPTVLR
jgi:hypothetical protein